ncbi:MAG: putative secreted protein [Planctomycetota bacterium]|nr:MAG: putative secreted protein [Planctomycetota bacterium]
MSRIAIIGAGPIGLEAALLARQLGHDVQVFEKGRVAENILDWGHVRLFSPFGMNSSEWGRGALTRVFGRGALPREEELLTGLELAERYLIPISQLVELEGRIHEQSQVLSINRRHFLKTAGIGSTARGAEPFQLLIEHRTDERVELADVVLDCSGTYPHHNWLGDGGQPCLGERYTLNESNYRLPDIRKSEFGDRIVLVVGSGFSAATSVVALADLAQQAPKTKVLWFANSQPNQTESAGPISRVPNDPLVARDQLAAKANELASLGHFTRSSSPETKDHPVVWFANVAIKSLRPTRTCRNFDGFEVELDWSRATEQGSTSPPRLTVDRIIANVGYRPDRSIYEELHVHECYATQGPIKLAAKLLGESSTDCLAQASHGADVLKNPEPNFFILGSKSYGRNSNFLLRVGHQQILEVFEMLNGGQS